jgi:predicted nucleic acid-binding protein
MRFVDSNVFIYVLDRHPRFGETAKRVLARIEKGEEALTSTLVIAEVSAYLMKRGREEEIGGFVDALRGYGSLLKKPCLFEDFIAAAELMQVYRIDWQDLVIVAQMHREGIREIYSNDSHFDLIPGIKRLFE